MGEDAPGPRRQKPTKEMESDVQADQEDCEARFLLEMAQKIDTHQGSVTVSQLEGQTPNTPILDLAQFLLPGLTKVVKILPTPSPSIITCSVGLPHDGQLSRHFFPPGTGEFAADQGWWGDRDGASEAQNPSVRELHQQLTDGAFPVSL